MRKSGSPTEEAPTGTHEAAESTAVGRTLTGDATLRATLAAMGDAVFIIDATGRVVDYNDAFVAYHRFDARADAAMPVAGYAKMLEVWRQDGQLLALDQWPLARALRGESGHQIVLRLRRLDIGESWYGSYNFAPVRADDGTIAGGVVSVREITAELEAQEALIAERRRLVLLMESTNGALWDVDLTTGRITTTARGWLRRYDVADSDVPRTLGQWVTRVHPADRSAVVDGLDALRKGTSQTVVLEYRFMGRPDHWRWIQSRALVSSRDADGRPQHITGLHLDIHERRQDEHALRESEERLQLVIQAAGLGVWDRNFANDTITHNDLMVSMLGYPPDRVLSRREWSALIHPDDFATSNGALTAHLAGREPYFGREMRLRRADGGWHWVMTLGQVVQRDADGRVLRVIGVNVDIAARKSAETAVAVSEARLRAVVDNVPIGILLFDTRGRPVFSNQAFRRIMGLSEAESRSLDWLSSIESGAREDIIRRHQAMLEGKEHELSAEYGYRTPHGETRVIRSRTVRVDTPHADFAFIGIGDDVTAERAREAERTRLMQQAQQSQKIEAIGQLAGGIAHDFNNILAAVVGFGELARARHIDNPRGKLAEYLDTIIAAGERGRALVMKMLAFSRTSRKDQAQTIEVLPAVSEVASMLGTLIPSTIHFRMEERGRVPPIAMDAVDLHQVLVNLILNARDAIAAHGDIVVTVGGNVVLGRHCAACHAEIGPQTVRIAVRDSGAGMDAATLARIFDPFYTTKDVGKGTGMGLSVVHGVVHQAGGHIVVESTPGAGTEFELLFPAAPTTAVDITGTSINGHSRTTHAGKRVCVVDDEAPVRNLLTDLLEGEGLAVTAAADGREALALMLAQPGAFDLLFTDQTMPQMTGLELVEALRAARVSVPVVLMSGYSDETSVRAAQRHGVRFLAKPAAPAEMLAALDSALNAPMP